VPQAEHLWVSIDDFNKPLPLQLRPQGDLAQALMTLQAVTKEFSVERERLYLMGYSNGGYGTWDLLERVPKMWAAAVPIAGGGDPRRISAAKSVPVWAFHGDKDATVPSPARARWLPRSKRSAATRS
jgi:predicted peptidase